MLTQERLKELLHYDPETGVFTWLVRARQQIRIGDVAGTLRKDGYRQIKVDKRLYLEHWLAWLYVYGGPMIRGIDHRDMTRDHNSIANLRPATVTQNLGNTRRRKDNTSGFKGVSLQGKKSKKWCAEIKANGHRVRLGRFDTPEEAHAAYCAAAPKYFGEFARTE